MNRRAAIVALASLPAAVRGIAVEASTGQCIFVECHQFSAAFARDFAAFQQRVDAAQRALLAFEGSARGVGETLTIMRRTLSGE